MLAAGGDASGKPSNPNKANAVYAIVFEAIALALHLDSDQRLLSSAVAGLGRFISSKEANVRCVECGGGISLKTGQYHLICPPCHLNNVPHSPSSHNLPPGA
jgi:hypothetical protein